MHLIVLWTGLCWFGMLLGSEATALRAVRSDLFASWALCSEADWLVARTELVSSLAPLSTSEWQSTTAPTTALSHPAPPPPSPTIPAKQSKAKSSAANSQWSVIQVRAGGVATGLTVVGVGGWVWVRALFGCSGLFGVLFGCLCAGTLWFGSACNCLEAVVSVIDIHHVIVSTATLLLTSSRRQLSSQLPNDLADLLAL